MTAECSVEGCLNPVKARGWCKTHYMRWFRYGDVGYKPVPAAVAAERFRADLTDPRHGTNNGYTNLRCHCDRCRAAWTAWFASYMDSHPKQREKARQRSRAYYQNSKEQG